jgi:hypothetical protein
MNDLDKAMGVGRIGDPRDKCPDLVTGTIHQFHIPAFKIFRGLFPALENLGPVYPGKNGSVKHDNNNRLPANLFS